jgi:hypothetical protein
VRHEQAAAVGRQGDAIGEGGRPQRAPDPPGAKVHADDRLVTVQGDPRLPVAAEDRDAPRDETDLGAGDHGERLGLHDMDRALLLAAAHDQAPARVRERDGAGSRPDIDAGVDGAGVEIDDRQAGLVPECRGDRGDAAVGRDRDLQRLAADVDEVGPAPSGGEDLDRAAAIVGDDEPPAPRAGGDRAPAKDDPLLGLERPRRPRGGRLAACERRERDAAKRAGEEPAARCRARHRRRPRAGAGPSSQSMAARWRARASAMARDESAVCGRRSSPPAS